MSKIGNKFGSRFNSVFRILLKRAPAKPKSKKKHLSTSHDQAEGYYGTYRKMRAFLELSQNDFAT